MAEHTPGPWRLDEAQRDVLALKIKRICEVPGYGVMSTGVDKANARLIAAAPDMVEALEKIAAEFCDADDCFASANARAALSLARGDADAGEGV